MRLPIKRASRRGFTLIEMLTVVVIVGVLATLAVYGVRQYILSSKTSEAISMMSSIKSAEEAFKGETFAYLDVSTDFSDASFYPKSQLSEPASKFGKHAWRTTATPDLQAKWMMLGVEPDGPVLFSYAVVAGAAGGTHPT